MPLIFISIARYRWTQVLAGLGALALLGLLWQSHQAAARHNRTLAQLDLDVISDSLKFFTAEGPAAIAQTTAASLNARELYNLLSATNTGEFLLEHRKEWDRRRELVDPWGHPFQFKLVTPQANGTCTNQMTEAGVRIWSMGPNGRDEQGQGDDITCQPVAIRLRP